MIRRNRSHLATLTFPDHGAKMILSIKRLEAECQRRKRHKVHTFIHTLH